MIIPPHFSIHAHSQSLPLSELSEHPIVRHPALIDLFMTGSVLGVLILENSMFLRFTPVVDLNAVMDGLMGTLPSPLKVKKISNCEIAVSWRSP